MRNDMIPTLDEISIEPEKLRLFLISQGLTEEFKEQSAINFDFKIENSNSFLWGNYSSFLNHRGGIYNYKFDNIELFYSIAFPSWTRSQINQLDTFIKFIDDLFSDGTFVENNGYGFNILNPSVTAITDYFKISKRANNKISFSSRHIDYVSLENTDFETVYKGVLDEFKNKLDIYFDEKDAIITTNVIRSIRKESIPFLIDRIYKDSSVKPVSNTAFLQGFDERTINIISQDNIKLGLDKLERGDIHIFNAENSDYYKISLCIDSISVLKNLLKESMIENDIRLLIQIISMAAFHQNIMLSDVNYFVFMRRNLFNVNKVKILENDFFYEIDVGDYSFRLGKVIEVVTTNFSDNILDNYTFSTLQQVYDLVFSFITEDICYILSTEPNNVCVQDLKVIEMTMF
jgi:hypothetical protein